MEDATAVQELLGWLLHKLEIPKRDLAAMLGVDRMTVSRWMETGYVDFGACRMLLQILEGDADSILPFLVERVKSQKERRPWPERTKRIRSSFNLTIVEFADLLMTNPSAVVNWEQGHSDPISCHAVILDLIEDHPDEMAGMLGFVPVEPGEESHDPWPKPRLLAILTKAGLSSSDFAGLVGIENQSVTSWFRGVSAPSACSAFFLTALEKFPQATLKLLRQVDKGSWAPGRAQAAREAAGLSMNELSRLTHVSARTLNGWEEEMPSRMDCPKVLYSLLERDPKGFLSFTERLWGRKAAISGDLSMGATFPTDGGSSYKLDSNGRPVMKGRNFPLLRAAVQDLYERLVRGELRDQHWYFQVLRDNFPVTCIPAFGLLGKEGRRDAIHMFGWCFSKDGEMWRGKTGMVATPTYMKSVDPENFDRSMVALDYLADHQIWGPWSEDFDAMVVSSLWRIYEGD